jgi:hypothetical protein
VRSPMGAAPPQSIHRCEASLASTSMLWRQVSFGTLTSKVRALSGCRLLAFPGRVGENMVRQRPSRYCRWREKVQFGSGRQSSSVRRVALKELLLEQHPGKKVKNKMTRIRSVMQKELTAHLVPIMKDPPSTSPFFRTALIASPPS